MKTKMDYVRHYRALYDNGCITLDQYGNALRDIRSCLNYVDMLDLERLRKK
jgi:hypothetical protein